MHLDVRVNDRHEPGRLSFLFNTGGDSTKGRNIVQLDAPVSQAIALSVSLFRHRNGIEPVQYERWQEKGYQEKDNVRV